MILRRSSSRCSRKAMVGISSFTGSFTDEDAVASGIGSYFRYGRRLVNVRVFCGRPSRDLGGLGSLKPFGRWRVKDAAGKRIQRRMERRQDLRLYLGLERVYFRFDLRLELVRCPLELVHETPDLAPDFWHFLGPENKQCQNEQEHHL